MPRLTPLHDEQPSKQEQQCRALGAEYHFCDDADDEDAPGFGADPFDIIAHREEHGIDNDA